VLQRTIYLTPENATVSIFNYIRVDFHLLRIDKNNFVPGIAINTIHDRKHYLKKIEHLMILIYSEELKS